MQRKFIQTSAWAIFFGIISLYGFSLWALFGQSNGETHWQLHDAWHIVYYSLLQAGLCATGAVLFGTLLARAFFYLEFKGKMACFKMMTFVWSLPSLVAIFAILSVWGNAGWLAKIAQFLGIPWSFQIYGLQGILLAHLFLNIPLATKYALSALNLISPQQFRLATQLNLRPWLAFYIVEFPLLKNMLPYVWLNIFLVCFTSFPIVLMLGGGPKYSTLEVAIYQAVAFEFDFHKAVWLILLQIVIGGVLQLLLEIFNRFALAKQAHQPPITERWKPTPTGWRKSGLQAVLILHFFAIFTPLAGVIWSGVSVSDLWQRLCNPILWEATWFSLILGFIAAVSAIVIAYLLALETRWLGFHRHKFAQSLLASASTYPLILPVFALAIGLFVLLMDVELSTLDLMLLVGGCNGLMLLPYVYRLIFLAMWQALVSQDKLARSLGLKGWRRWWIVEKSYLIKPLANAFALAMASSLGSFTVIAFFGNPDFSTLPYLLYQQLGSYRTEDAAVTALILMLCALLPFLFIEQEEK